jgi:TRAP-type C4-dicarboxylate transport system substrate-binding protein
MNKSKIQNPIKTLIMLIVMLSFFATSIFSVTIKIGSIAPQRSPWDKALRELSREWSKITNGQVKLKIYAGGVVGSEGDMIRKMRLGQLGGAGFTNRGLSKLYRDVYVLNIPFLFDTEGELDYVINKMMPLFEKKIEEKGYKFIIWTMAGWVQLYTKNKVIYPKDLKKHKISFATGEPEMEQFWKKSGFQVIPNDLKDMMMGLQSGMVNAFYLPPLMAAAGQYFPLAPHMCSFKVAPLFGGIVLTKKIWNKIPDEFKPKMLEVTKRISKNLYKKTKELEKEALDKMLENGLIINEISPEIIKEWKVSTLNRLDSLVGKAFSKEIYQVLRKYLEEYRKSNAK